MGDTERLEHMLEAAQKAVFVATRTSRSDLEDDEVLSLALIKLIEIVGEAGARVSDEQRGASPDIPWDNIIGMRNRLVHAYDDINLDALWKTIEEDLPALIAELERAIAGCGH